MNKITVQNLMTLVYVTKICLYVWGILLLNLLLNFNENKPLHPLFLLSKPKQSHHI